jgi:formate dehydrogenase subunit gamma
MSLPGGLTELIDKSFLEAKDKPGSLFYILNKIKDELGYIPENCIHDIADRLNISKTEVYGFITFFKDYKTTPPAVHKIVTCLSESCQATCANELVLHIKNKLNIDFGQKTPDGAYSLDYVYCFGNCAASPSAMIDGKLYGSLTADMFDKIFETLTPK